MVAQSGRSGIHSRRKQNRADIRKRACLYRQHKQVPSPGRCGKSRLYRGNEVVSQGCRPGTRSKSGRARRHVRRGPWRSTRPCPGLYVVQPCRTGLCLCRQWLSAHGQGNDRRANGRGAIRYWHGVRKWEGRRIEKFCPGV